ncbi:hypothetical protein DPMN_177283 [Dreissena polymorpha]|uniref:C2H2-type domain-containing protein n=1 Tax=Dreissena polymorpha TaxID=45954 RepID=A0A9D4EAR5_DREPO|nr:hypothetical protein DPMN_177283 [Dreissena polymorpha]
MKTEHDSSEVFSCQICDLEFPSMAALMSHQNAHKPKTARSKHDANDGRHVSRKRRCVFNVPLTEKVTQAETRRSSVNTALQSASDQSRWRFTLSMRIQPLVLITTDARSVSSIS